MSTMTIEQAVRDVAVSNFGPASTDQYDSIVRGVIANYNEGGPAQAKEFLTTAGHGNFARLVDEVAERVGYQPSEISEVEDFDKETACEVIRAFLIGEENYDDAEVDALLVLAGLEDEVIPEPEPERAPDALPLSDVDRLASLVNDAVQRAVAPLVEFARGHGYQG